MSIFMELFDNKLTLCAMLMLWTIASSAVFCFIMIKDRSKFLTLGPNDSNQLLGVKMDTWFKWWVTAVYTFLSTAIAAFAGDALCPFFSNVIEDHKTKHIPYSKFTCLLIVQCFTIYGVIMSVIGMFVALTQVDFMLIRIAADLLVNSHTTYYFLRGKEVDPVRYNMWKHSCESDKHACGPERNGHALHKILQVHDQDSSEHGENAVEDSVSQDTKPMLREP